MNIYSVKNISKSYGQKSPNILKRLSFDIYEGEILGILGVNGVGKTTLIKLLLQMLEVTDGKIDYLGQDLTKISLTQYYQRVSAVLEKDRNVYWYLTGMQNIRYFGRLKRLEDNEITEKAHQYLKVFDLYDARDQIAGTYSRGMLQKLAIIITMLGDPQVLFLDEPTLGLDVITRKLMMQNLKQLAEQKKTTIIITSHQLDVLDEIADRILLIEDGMLAYIGKTSEFKRMYSQNKYTITLNGKLDKDDEVFEDFKVVEKGATTEITLQNVSNREIERLISHILQKDYEISALTKDSHRLEDVMELFVRRGDDKK